MIPSCLTVVISRLRWTCLTLSSWTVGSLSSCRRKRKWGRARRRPSRHRYLTKPTEGWHSFLVFTSWHSFPFRFFHFPLLTFLSPVFQLHTLTLFQDFLDFVSADEDGRLEEFLGVKITSWQLQKVSCSKFIGQSLNCLFQPKKPPPKESTPPAKEPTPPPKEPTPPPN